MPLLKRLFWPLLLLPLAGAAAVLYGAVRSARASPTWMALCMLLPAFSGLVYAALTRVYQQWSRPPPREALSQALVPPEPVVLVSRGGFLTPASGFFTRQNLFLFAGGRRVVTLPLEQVGKVELARGKLLRTPYIDFTSTSGKKLGRLGVESAEAWVPLLQQLCLRSR